MDFFEKRIIKPKHIIEAPSNILPITAKIVLMENSIYFPFKKIIPIQHIRRWGKIKKFNFQNPSEAGLI